MVSELCLGTMTFGEADENSFMHKVGCDEATSHAIMNKAVDAGVNFIDTADVYGQDGLSERVIGNWFDKDRRRDEVVLATKFRFTMGTGPNSRGASRYRIVRCCEDSLRRLKTDRIDLYQIHCQDNSTPELEILRALDDLIRQGKVLYAGCSNYTAYRLMDSVWVSRSRGLAGYVTHQARYSLVARELEREHVPLCRETGIGILAYSPLSGGLLTGKVRKGQAAPEGTRLGKWKERAAQFDNDRNWRIVEAVDAVGKQVGASSSQVALAWLLRNPAVSSAIFGARSLAQLEDNLGAVSVKLDDQHMGMLDQAAAYELGYPYEFIANVNAGRW